MQDQHHSKWNLQANYIQLRLLGYNKGNLKYKALDVPGILLGCLKESITKTLESVAIVVKLPSKQGQCPLKLERLMVIVFLSKPYPVARQHKLPSIWKRIQSPVCKVQMVWGLTSPPTLSSHFLLSVFTLPYSY